MSDVSILFYSLAVTMEHLTVDTHTGWVCQAAELQRGQKIFLCVGVWTKKKKKNFQPSPGSSDNSTSEPRAPLWRACSARWHKTCTASRVKRMVMLWWWWRLVLVLVVEGTKSSKKKKKFPRDGERAKREKWMFCKAGSLITQWVVNVAGNNGIV